MSHSEDPASAPGFSSLLRRAQQEDRSAFDLIEKKHRGRIRSLCVRLLQSETEGEEAAQDTFLRAWEHLSTFCGTLGDADHAERIFVSWLTQIATNRCVNITRTVKWKKERSSLRAPLEVLELYLPPDRGFEREAIGRGNAERLSRLIREYGQKSRPRWQSLDVLIFHLVYEQGVETTKEVAEIVGRHRDTVTARLVHRIRPVLAAVCARLMEEDHPL